MFDEVISPDKVGPTLLILQQTLDLLSWQVASKPTV